MAAIPVLLIEDEAQHQERLTMLLEELGVHVSWQAADNYDDAVRAIEAGTYAIAFVDLQLPGGSKDLVGLDLISKIRECSKDGVVAAYTAFSNMAATELVARTDGLLQKTKSDDVLKNELDSLLAKVSSRFDFDIDVDLDSALEYAFPEGAPEWASKPQWELCVRRIFGSASGTITYDSVGSGRSGAGIVAAWPAAGELPLILKLDRYARLVDEAERHRKFVHNRIPRRTETDKVDGLAQAGPAGVLAYSFVGMAGNPLTLHHALQSVDSEQIQTAIQRHFNENVKRWFAASKDIEKPHDLAGAMRRHFGVSAEKLRVACATPVSDAPCSAAARYIRNCTRTELIDAVTDAVDVRRRKVQCKEPVIVHGDLNSSNLIWDGNDFWMIDFAHTTDDGLRMMDFVKLEASLKFDIKNEFVDEAAGDANLKALLTAEELLVDELLPELQQSEVERETGLMRKLSAIRAVRECALKHCGATPDLEYRLALFMMTAKHAQHLADDLQAGRPCGIALTHALVSAYRLCNWKVVRESEQHG